MPFVGVKSKNAYLLQAGKMKNACVAQEEKIENGN